MFRETHFFAYYLSPVFMRISKAVLFIKTIMIFTVKKGRHIKCQPSSKNYKFISSRYCFTYSRSFTSYRSGILQCLENLHILQQQPMCPLEYAPSTKNQSNPKACWLKYFLREIALCLISLVYALLLDIFCFTTFDKYLPPLQGVSKVSNLLTGQACGETLIILSYSSFSKNIMISPAV